MELNNAIQIAQDFLGKEYFSILKIRYVDNKSGNKLSVLKSGNDVTISYGKLVELFYGLSLIKQNVNQNEYQIELTSHFENNGLMFDCSRNGVLNVNKVKEMILIHALLGLNRFMLYTEDTYEIKDEPYFGYLRGRYTADELKEIIDYASSFGVEVVPCIQTLSHLNQALRWTSQYGAIRSSEQTLKLDEEKIYDFIEKMVKTCASTFKTKSIHIGMDEAIDIGLFDFLFQNKNIDKKGLMLKHLKRVVEICHKYGLKPMMWADMFFKIDPKGTLDWYNFVGKLEDDIKKEIPEDMELVYWDYYHDDIETYDKMMKACLDTGRKVIFGSGMIRWIGFVPNFNCSFRKCRAGLKAAIKNKVPSLIATSWGDGGDECNAVSVYPFLALHSVYDYYGKDNEKALNGLVKAVTGQSLKEWFMMSLPNEISGKELLPFENPSKAFLYNDPMLGMFDTRAFDNFPAIYKEHAKKLAKESKKSLHFAYVYQTSAALCDLLADKVCLGKNTREAYQKHDLETLKGCLLSWCKVKKKLERFIVMFRNQWYCENKVVGYEVTDGRLGFLKQRIETTIWSLDKYLKGEIKSIPELEETILPYNGSPNDEAHCYNTWSEIVSASIVK